MTRDERPPLDLSPAEWAILAGCLIMCGLIAWCGWLLFVPVTP